MATIGRVRAARHGLRAGRAMAGPLVLAALLVAGLHSPRGTAAADARPDADPLVACGVGTPTPYLSPQARSADTLAVVRTPGGQVRVVSFERGWAVYNGRVPGTFLRICRA